MNYKGECMNNKIIISFATIIILFCQINAENNGTLFNQTMEQVVHAIGNQDWVKTAELGRKIIDMKPDYIWGYYYYGLGLSYSGQLKKGEVNLKKVLKMDKNHFWANYILFFNYVLQEKRSVIDQAERVEPLVTKDLIKSNPFEIKSFYQTYADQMSKQNKKKDARKILQKGIKLFPKDPILFSQYAFTYFRVDMKKWKKLSRQSIKLVPKNERTAINLYQFPLKGKRIKVHQGNFGGISHEGLLNAYSWDFMNVDEKNHYYKGENKKDNYYVFNQPVYTALDGKVTFVYDLSPDTEPLKNDPNAEVNMITILHKNNESSLYIHLKKGSSLVKVGDTVKKDQKIALVGASGRYVDIPHLHFQINRNGICVEAKLTGLKVLKNKKWVAPNAYTPQQDDILMNELGDGSSQK